MNESTRPRALSLLRLIVELRGSDLPSNDVFLAEIGERAPEALAAELAELEAEGLITWSEAGEQWTPTMRGLMLGIALPAYEPVEEIDLGDAHAECA
jgi:predicted transcriptional regulator